MNIARKLEIAKTAIDSITQHSDADSTVLKAAVAALQGHLDAGVAAIEARAAAEVAEALGATEA